MTTRRNTAARALSLAALTALATLTTACETTDRAVDCAKLALAVSRDIDDLERAAIGSALDQDATEVTEAIEDDAEKVKERTDNADVGKAADDVAKAAKDVAKASTEDRDPDLTPLKDAGTELTKVCATG